MPSLQLAEDDLFVLDVQPDNAHTHVVSRPHKRPRASKEPRLTRAQLILQAGSKDVRPMGTGAAYAPKAKKSAKCTTAIVVRCAIGAAYSRHAAVLCRGPRAGRRQFET